jgi:hypothetical protein
VKFATIYEAITGQRFFYHSMITRLLIFKSLIACFLLLIVFSTIRSLSRNERDLTIESKKEEFENIKPLIGNSTKEAKALAEYAKIQLVQPRATNNIYELGLRLRVLRRLLSLEKKEKFMSI